VVNNQRLKRGFLTGIVESPGRHQGINRYLAEPYFVV